EIIDPASSDNSQTYFYSNEYGNNLPALEIEFATDTDNYPTANPGGPYTGSAGTEVILNGSASYDLNGYITNYTWDFGEGNYSYGKIVTHTYTNKGTYTITLMVTDDTNAKNSEITTIIIQDTYSIEISSAKLKLYYYQNEDGDTAGHTLNLYRITSDWNKENVTWNTRPNYNGTIIASAVVPSTVGTWIEWDVTNDVQSFINGQTTNYGWEIIDPASSDNSQTYFYSNEYGNNLPALEIEFATDTSKQTFYPIADVYIAENHPTYILNNETFVRIRGLAGWHFNGLFQFDITSIVPGTSDHVEKTPGFEVLFILFASVLLLIWKRRK
ncbi:MAG: DNRLRE domain-containing protein, partial [Euryarchaeota archaeon]|nr:DNRLRE domain-containing protein [Euryarchaeota archaeon]